MRITLTLLLQVAGVLHLALIGAGVLMPKVVRMHWHLAELPPFIRQLFWVNYMFIGLCVVSFSLVTLFFADTLAAGGPLPQALCAFFAIFWTLRLVVAAFVFDMEPYLGNRFRRFGYVALNVVFAYLPVAYVLAASQPRWLK